MNTRTVVLHAVIGALAFIAIQLLLFVLAGDAPATSESGSGWFLNTAASLAAVVGIIAAASAVLALVTPHSNVWQGSGAFAAGATIAMAVSLFVIGPGNIFPIVIVVGGAFITIAAFAGGVLVVAARALLRRRPAPRVP